MGKNWNMNSRLLKTMGNLSFSVIFCFITYIDVPKKKKVSSRIKDQKKSSRRIFSPEAFGFSLVLSFLYILKFLCDPDQQFHGLLHGLDAYKFIFAMGVVVSSAEVGTRKAHIGQPGAVGTAAHRADVGRIHSQLLKGLGSDIH